MQMYIVKYTAIKYIQYLQYIKGFLFVTKISTQFCLLICDIYRCTSMIVFLQFLKIHTEFYQDMIA